jgi:UDP-GlcNAc:undecaprenyl-phosphate/decaprenyl-phosphate GlcNAc-1-phosphate transferase
LSDEVRVVGAVLVSLVAVSALTPFAIRLAERTSFYDNPVGYKAHAAPTAYLGGAAVLGGFILAALLFGHGLGRFLPIVACALALSAIGTLDDRMAVKPSYRLLAGAGAATVLWLSGLGWSFLDSRFEELVLTSLWVVAFTTSFNLLDNMDGAASSVGSICAAAIAGLSLVEGDAVLAAFALALAGACAGFLRYNLRPGGPARIFLGDGGSMPIGFVLAAATMNVPVDERLGWPVLLVAGMLLAIPVLDTLLVVVSRTRRGVSLVTAGRDHLTHRLHMRMSARTVALALGLLQAAVALLAIGALQLGRTAIIVAALSCLALGGMIVAALETPAWATARPARRTPLAPAVRE